MFVRILGPSTRESDPTPAGPAGPVGPAYPCGPAAPCGPLAPEGPCGPCVPLVTAMNGAIGAWDRRPGDTACEGRAEHEPGEGDACACLHDSSSVHCRSSIALPLGPTGGEEAGRGFRPAASSARAIHPSGSLTTRRSRAPARARSPPRSPATRPRSFETRAGLLHLRLGCSFAGHRHR